MVSAIVRMLMSADIPSALTCVVMLFHQILDPSFPSEIQMQMCSMESLFRMTPTCCM